MTDDNLRSSEIDRFLFDVTESMANDSEDGGDSDADYNKNMKIGDSYYVSCGDLSISKWKDRGKTSVMVVCSIRYTSEEAEVQRRNKTG
ncbi:hypothetical protein J6590_091086 [Homalodisca vitripennis]|nr:hypothetical protein J6590_091086 [Homalodisca vitripennis]